MTAVEPLFEMLSPGICGFLLQPSLFLGLCEVVLSLVVLLSKSLSLAALEVV
jgi:hypothetical protein